MNWDEYFMEMAYAVAKKSSDPSTKVGCVIVDQNNIVVSVGYNDFFDNADMSYMTYERPMKYELIVHAEMRALLNAKKSIYGCRSYVTLASCENCLKHQIYAGIKEIIYDKLNSTGSMFTEEKIDIITRLIKASNIINRNMKGVSFIDECSNKHWNSQEFKK